MYRWLLTLPQTSRVHFGGNSPHPRSESKGLPTAIGDLLSPNAKYKRDKIGGHPLARQIGRSQHRILRKNRSPRIACRLAAALTCCNNAKPTSLRLRRAAEEASSEDNEV